MDSLQDLHDLFHVKVSRDKLVAELWYNEINDNNIEWQCSVEEVTAFLKENNITFGLVHSTIDELVHQGRELLFPLTIAKGTPAEHGTDGRIEYTYDLTTEIDRSHGFDFRDVMRIPSVQEGEEIAKVTSPTGGKDGRSVFDTVIQAKPGKKVPLRAGKNVTADEEERVFYANQEGQVSIANHRLHVYPIYEINEDISLKVGNIDFLGTVVVRGNVPTGFKVKATGDIKVYGLVEGAELVAEGSVFISEGIAGIRQGSIKAEEDVYTGYINQGTITANNIYVNRSMLHSDCTAVRTIHCEGGNIIGGILSAGELIIAKDVGNRMNTVTELSLGVDKERYDRQTTLEKERKVEQDNLRKLSLLKDKLGTDKNLDRKARITLLKVRNSLEQITDKIKEMDMELEHIHSSLHDIDQSFLFIRGTIYPNTTVSFGKYRRTIDKPFDNVTIKMKSNEITIV